MAIVYAPKRYELKTIGNLIKDKSAQEKALIKAQELGKIKLPNKFTQVGQDGAAYEITIINQPIEKNGLLEVSVEATKNGQKVFVSNPLYFQNPPIMVADGTYHKEFDPLLKVDVDVPNYVENPLEVLKSIIVDTVRITGK